MYKGHQGADALETVVTDNDDFGKSISVSASVKDGKTLVTIANISCDEDAEITLDSLGSQLPQKGRITILSHKNMNAHNTFDSPDTVKSREEEFSPEKPVLIPKAGIVALEF